MTFKTIRVTVLCAILAYIVLDRLIIDQRASDWKRSLRVVIYPINGDGSPATDRYIKQLSKTQFSSINQTLTKQSARYGKILNEPIRFDLAPILNNKPPALPKKRSGLGVLMWSLKLRYWSWKNDDYQGPKAQVKAYALFFDPKQFQRLPHSTGLKEAKIAINYLYADKRYSHQNTIVLLHELLHTLGATDKYNLTTGFPHYPDGFANVHKQPLYPQEFAEIMGGRIALSDTHATMPKSLREVIIGPKTAKEIGWIP